MYRETPSEELSGSSQLEPEILRGLEGQGDLELARRALWGAMVYFVVCAVVAVATPYYAEHPFALLLNACLTFLMGGLRLVSARRLLRTPACNHKILIRVLKATTYATFAVWGVFCGWTVQWYAGEWTAMLLLLCTAALAGGASSTLAPQLPMAYRCLFLLIFPSVVSIAYLGGVRYLGLAALGAMYLIFLLVQARNTGRAFWQARAAAEREKSLGSAERMRAETERVRLAAAVEQTAEEIVIADVQGNIQYCNPSFEHLTGYSRSEVIGRNPRFLKSGEQDAQFYKDLWATILGGGIWTGRFVNRKKDGSLYYAEGTISPIHDASGNPAGFVSATRDVTGRLRMEEQLRQAQKMEGIGRLAGGVAHDFNNLLTVIAGYAGLLENKLAGDPSLLDYAQQIAKASAHAAGLTKQLLTFSRRQIIKPKPLDLNVFVEGMRPMLQRLMGEDVDVITDLAPSLGLVRADADQTSQILINLTANARDAMPHGGKLYIRTANTPPAKRSASSDGDGLPVPSVLLAVSDTGVGMTYETRQNIFEPFFTTKERGKGTGLGLSTVYGIVKQNNGAIDVLSHPGKGATFSIYFPRIDAAPAVPEPAKAVALPLRGSETILVAEDHEDVRSLIVGTLELSGFQVLPASDGASALQKAAAHDGTIHLLLTDVIMPGMNGKVVAEQLAALRPGIKVLFISGYSGELIAHRGVLAAGVDYLAKPFTPGGLLAKVREMLGSANPVPPRSV